MGRPVGDSGFVLGTMGPLVHVFPFEQILRSEPGLENRRLGDRDSY